MSENIVTYQEQMREARRLSAVEDEWSDDDNRVRSRQDAATNYMSSQETQDLLWAKLAIAGRAVCRFRDEVKGGQTLKQLPPSVAAAYVKGLADIWTAALSHGPVTVEGGRK